MKSRARKHGSGLSLLGLCLLPATLHLPQSAATPVTREQEGAAAPRQGVGGLPPDRNRRRSHSLLAPGFPRPADTFQSPSNCPPCSAATSPTDVPPLSRAEMTRTVRGVVLAGGQTNNPLTRHRAMPAVPLGSSLLMIDVPLNLCLQAGVNKM